MTRARTLLLLSTLLLPLAAPAARAADAVASPRLYAMDCGHFETTDMAGFSDVGDYDGKPAKLIAPCYVIEHPKGILVWDTGLPDAMADKKEGVTNGAIHMSVPVRFADQLKAIGVAPADVTFVAFSHGHFDHLGNAPMFTTSTWLLNSKEVAWTKSQPTPFGADPVSMTPPATAKTELFTGDKDVFGDGSVRILAAPGHTPGHAVLMLKLQKSGVVILSGDLYHAVKSRQLKRIPVFNDSRAETMASIDRIETIVKLTHARFYIEHAVEDFARMPKTPAYMD